MMNEQLEYGKSLPSRDGWGEWDSVDTGSDSGPLGEWHNYHDLGGEGYGVWGGPDRGWRVVHAEDGLSADDDELYDDLTCAMDEADSRRDQDKNPATP